MLVRHRNQRPAQVPAVFDFMSHGSLAKQTNKGYTRREHKDSQTNRGRASDREEGCLVWLCYAHSANFAVQREDLLQRFLALVFPRSPFFGTVPTMSANSTYMQYLLLVEV